MTNWKEVKGYEKLYLINDKGEVYSIKRDKILKKRLTFDGYVKVTLTNNYNSRDFRVHRLVAEHFIPNSKNKETVNHIDGNKENNHVDNLEWATRSEQNLHSYKLGLKKAMIGEENKNSKLSAEQVREIRKSYVKGDKVFGAMNLGRIHGVGPTTIENIVKGKTYKNVE